MRALSLEYHDVVDGDDLDGSGFQGAGPASYKLTRVQFDRHVDAIARVVRRPPGRAIDWLKDLSGERPLFLTFDDGGVGAHTCIADTLERLGWRGHFLITAGRIGTQTFLSAGQLRELHARGHVIGTHSYSHPMRMGACSPARVLDEWQRSVGVLSGILGEPVIIGSVPGGYYTRPVAEAAVQAGLKLLFTSAPTSRCRVVDGCRILGRYTMRRWSTVATAAALADGRLLPRASQWAFYSSLNLLRTIAGDRYTQLRQRYWAARA